MIAVRAALWCLILNLSMSSDSAKAVHIIETEGIRRRVLERQMTRHWGYIHSEIKMDRKLIDGQADKIRAQELAILESADRSIQRAYSLTRLDQVIESRMEMRVPNPDEIVATIRENRLLREQNYALQQELNHLKNSTSLQISRLKATLKRLQNIDNQIQILAL